MKSPIGKLPLYVKPASVINPVQPYTPVKLKEGCLIVEDGYGNQVNNADRVLAR